MQNEIEVILLKVSMGMMKPRYSRNEIPHLIHWFVRRSMSLRFQWKYIVSIRRKKSGLPFHVGMWDRLPHREALSESKKQVELVFSCSVWDTALSRCRSWVGDSFWMPDDSCMMLCFLCIIRYKQIKEGKSQSYAWKSGFYNVPLVNVILNRCSMAPLKSEITFGE